MSSRKLATANEVKRNCTRVTECAEVASSETASRWIDHVTADEGEMSIGAQSFPIGSGDTLRIAPRTPHRITAPASGPLILLCCCSPAYAHADTELQDASVRPQDASVRPQDDSMKRPDTSLRLQDASLMPQDTSVMRPDASMTPQDASLRCQEASPGGRDAFPKLHPSRLAKSEATSPHRHYGLLSPTRKKEALAAARVALNVPPPMPAVVESVAEFMQRVRCIEKARCPHCGIGQFRVVATLLPQRDPPKLRGPPS